MRSKPPIKNPGISPGQGAVGIHPDVPRARFFWNTYDIDSTLAADRVEGKWHEPQVIINGAFPHSLWSHRIDRVRNVYYTLRQIYSFPYTIIGWVRYPCLMFVGMFIRHLTVALWAMIGWYSIIPVGIIVLLLTISLLMVNIRHDMFFPSLSVITLILMGGFV